MKVVVITGSRKGIGKHLCEYYLQKNLTVIGCSRTNSDLLHDNYTHYTCDISKEEAVIGMFKDIKKSFGKVDILINNAGAASMNHVLLTPAETFRKLFEVNTLGTFLVTRECSKIMMKHKSGRIVNFTTVAVPLNLSGETAYASSKSAVEQLTKNLAKELSPYNITVNAIGPTPIDTDLIKAVPKDKIQALIDHQAVKRMGTFSDVTNLIDFFVKDDSDFITGQIVYLGGIIK